MNTPGITVTPDTKMNFLIKRGADTSREELVAHWFSNHMPEVIETQARLGSEGKLHATRYIATLYDPPRSGEQVWDGVAQLWFAEAPPAPREPHGTKPRDTFQQKVEPYNPWATTEHVVLDGELPLEPNTLNDPFPCTRSGLLKITVLLAGKPGIDYDEFFTHWLEVHAPNVRNTMKATGGYRYVISLSDDPESERYAGMAELYFADKDSLAAYGKKFKPDGMDHWVDRANSPTFRSGTEMVGIA